MTGHVRVGGPGVRGSCTMKTRTRTWLHKADLTYRARPKNPILSWMVPTAQSATWKQSHSPRCQAAGGDLDMADCSLSVTLTEVIGPTIFAIFSPFLSVFSDSHFLSHLSLSEIQLQKDLHCSKRCKILRNQLKKTCSIYALTTVKICFKKTPTSCCLCIAGLHLGIYFYASTATGELLSQMDIFHVADSNSFSLNYSSSLWWIFNFSFYTKRNQKNRWKSWFFLSSRKGIQFQFCFCVHKTLQSLYIHWKTAWSRWETEKRWKTE